MVESNFKYTNELLKKINSNATKNINLFCQIAMLIILMGSGVLFVTHNFMLGAIFAVIFVGLVVCLVLTNKTIANANRVLLGQKINIKFDENSMKMIASLNDKVLYNATFEYKAIKKVVEKQGVAYIYFDKTSAIVVPKNSFETSSAYEKAMQLVSNNYIV